MTDSFAARLQATLNTRGMTQAQLASAVGVTPAAVSTWMRGSIPRLAKLNEVADALSVSTRYLSVGEGDTPVDVEGLRVRYERDLTVFARPEHFDGGREFGNPAEHAFELNLQILGREVGQNSSDEMIDGQPGVDMVFTLMELAGQEYERFASFDWWKTYRRHLDAAADAKAGKASRQLKRSLELLDSERKLTMLRIDDYGANGLTGDEYDRGRFTAVMRNQLDSQKATTGGGSFGLGKNAMWGCSEFSLVLVNSQLSVPDGGSSNDRFFGRGQLPAHTLKGKNYAGPIWIGQPDHQRPNPNPSEPPAVRSIFGNPVLASDHYLSRANDRRPGTSFLIVGFYDPSGTATTTEAVKAELVRSMATNFWAAMTPADDSAPLTVKVKTEKTTEVLTHDMAKAGFVQAYERHLAGDTVSTPQELQGQGDVVAVPVTLNMPKRVSEPRHPPVQHEALLLVRLADEDEQDVNRLVTMRGNRMTVTEERISGLPVGAAPFHAVLLAGRAAGEHAAGATEAEAFLRAAEPPQHDRWLATADLTASYARGARQALLDFQRDVRKAVRDAVSRTVVGRSDGPDDLKALLRVVGPPRPPVASPSVTLASGKPNASGEWEIEAKVRLPVMKRKRLKDWRLTPVIKFATESGPAIPVRWKEITALERCRVEGNQLVAENDVRGLRFRGVTDASSHPLNAQRARVIVDVQAHEEKVL